MVEFAVQHFDVIVIGVGAMGSSACYHMAKRGVRVLGLEQFGIPHMFGSSHGDSRMIRLCYYEHPDYVPLLKRAYELWADLEEQAQQQLLFKTGGVYLGQADCDFIVNTLRAAREHHLPHERLDRSQIAARFPQFTVPDDHIAVYEPEAGFLLPERVVATQTMLALQHGATLHTHETVLHWQCEGQSVTVRTDRETYSADRIVVCGGAWSDGLIASRFLQDRLKLQVTRQVLGWVWPRTPEAFALGALPVWAINNLDGSIHYGFPMLPSNLAARPGFKIAHHFHGEPTTADSINRVPQPQDEQDFRHVLERFIPDANGPLLSMAICMYTNTPDSHFVIDAHPECDRTLIACGFSGHGFKFASVVGEILADLAIGGSTAQPIQFLGLDRFRGSASSSPA